MRNFKIWLHFLFCKTNSFILQNFMIRKINWIILTKTLFFFKYLPVYEKLQVIFLYLSFYINSHKWFSSIEKKPYKIPNQNKMPESGSASKWKGRIFIRVRMNQICNTASKYLNAHRSAERTVTWYRYWL